MSAVIIMIVLPNNFQEISYNHLLIPSRIAEPKAPIEDMMLDTVQPKPHTLSR